MVAIFSADHTRARCLAANVAASPAAFQPRNAAIMIGALSCGVPRIASSSWASVTAPGYSRPAEPLPPLGRNRVALVQVSLELALDPLQSVVDRLDVVAERPGDLLVGLALHIQGQH